MTLALSISIVVESGHMKWPMCRNSNHAVNPFKLGVCSYSNPVNPQCDQLSNYSTASLIQSSSTESSTGTVPWSTFDQYISKGEPAAEHIRQHCPACQLRLSCHSLGGAPIPGPWQASSKLGFAAIVGRQAAQIYSANYSIPAQFIPKICLLLGENVVLMLHLPCVQGGGWH